MNYIIFDLEFNSGRIKGTDKMINEIIEIGAVKLDDKLNETGSYSKTVKPQLTRKLNKYVKELTDITDDELKNASPFCEVIEDFKNWCGDDCIFSSWSTTDLFVLTENYSAVFNAKCIDFIGKYFDMQKFVTRDLHKNDNNQISLKTAADSLGADTDDIHLHRAFDDSRVCAELFRRTYNKRLLKNYIFDTAKSNYFERISFKPYYITDLQSEFIKKSDFTAKCPYCRRDLSRSSSPYSKYNAFFQRMHCIRCNRKFILQVRIKKTYDSTSTRKKLTECLPKNSEQTDE